jgi:VWFA-related protein
MRAPLALQRPVIGFAICLGLAVFVSLCYSQANSQSKDQGKTISPAAPAEDDIDVVKVDSELTTILMTATDKSGRLITTLVPEDIRVYEDGVLQQIAVFERQTDRPLSLALAFDISGSQTQTLSIQKAAARLFLKTIFRPDRDKVAILSFGSQTILQQNFVVDLRSAEKAIDQLGISGGTALFDAIFLACRQVMGKSSPNTRRAIILLTDAKDTMSRLSPVDAVNGAVHANTIVYGIGVGDSVEGEILEYLTNQTGGRAFFPNDKKQLTSAFAKIEEELRSQFLIGYRPTNRIMDGKRRNLAVEIVNPAVATGKVRLAYRDHYYARKRSIPVGGS